MRHIVAGASALLLLSLHVHAIRDGTRRRTMKKLTGIAPSPGVDARGYCHPTEQNQPGDCTHGERGWLEVGERSGIRTLEQCAQASIHTPCAHPPQCVSGPSAHNPAVHRLCARDLMSVTSS